MTGGLIMFVCAAAVLAAAILTDTAVAWGIRRWRSSVWGERK